MKRFYFAMMALLGLMAEANAQEVQATVYLLTEAGQGAKVGTISFSDTVDGLLVKEDFSGLPEGEHGIHVHQYGNCGFTLVDGKMILGGAAGGHYDPKQTGKHLGPNAQGHKGDLPVIKVGEDGKVATSFYLQGVTAEDFKDRAVIIHDGGDNYQDAPKPLGGGGDRIACGVIE